MRLYLLFFTLLISSALQAQLQEFSVSEMPRPETPVVQANAQFSDDALLLIYSTIINLDFRSSLGAIDKVSYNSTATRYEVLVKPVKQMIFVAKAGFIENKISTLNPNPKEVLYFKVDEKNLNVISQTAPGILQISSKPQGADIYINDFKVSDKTPKEFELTGNTRVKLKKKDYYDYDTTIYINDKSPNKLSVLLKPSYLFVNVRTQPLNAEVKLGDKIIGTSPLVNFKFDFTKEQPSEKLLKINIDGYEPISNVIKLEPSEIPLDLNYELIKLKGELLINSDPQGASVYLDGIYRGLTPLCNILEFGNYKVSVKSDGYWPSPQKEIVIQSTALQEIDFKLIPSPSPGEEQKYSEVKIGKQVWMAENLNTDHFQNGDLISEFQSVNEWVDAPGNKQPSWCYYDNNPLMGQQYGKLYNWYTVADTRGLCPAGWHVPNDVEWMQLISYLGGDEVAGIKMKSKTGWELNNSGNNKSGFNGLPGGYRFGTNGTFDNFGYFGYWWSSSEYSKTNARGCNLTNSMNNSNIFDGLKNCGFSVRCIKD